MRYLILSALLILVGANVVFAQSSDFIVRTTIIDNSDTTSPTTPVLLTVDPVTTTQINVSWSASTDDFAVAGYAVWRDGAAIATTTLLSYSDTGLTPSTTYSYVVWAFDASFNYSSSSNSLATTTPDTPAPTPASTDTGTESTAARVVVNDFFIKEGVSTTSLHLNTARPARIEVRWGRTTSYELGSVINSEHTREHVTLLTDLEPGTTYEYEIIGYTSRGNPSTLRTGSFTTLSNSLVLGPENVGRFTAAQNGDDVDLSWQTPTSDSISQIRIVRSHLGFPEHPQDGAIIYQGLNESFQDVAILTQYSPVYYTAFVYDKFGNISSGAVAIVYAQNLDVGPLEEDTNKVPDSSDVTTPVIKVPEVIEEATSSISVDRVTVDMKMPQPSEIIIFQGGESYSMLDTNIALDSEQSFVISIPYKAVAGNLKSIIVTVLDPTDNREAYSYLLRINKDRSAYEATVAAFEVEGRSQIKLEIFDYEAFVVASYQVPIKFISLPEEEVEETVFLDAVYGFPYKIALAVAFPFFLILILFLFYRSRTEDKE